jgi:hypothetical protein
MKTYMHSDTGNEFEANYNAHVAKIRKAAAIALKELDRLLSGGFVTQDVLDAEVARIAHEKLHSHGCDLVVHRTDDGIARLLIKVHGTGRKYDLIKSFFHRDDGSLLTAEVWLMTLDLKGKKVVVIGGKHSVEGATAEAVANEGADAVIWLRKWNDDGNEAKVLPIAQLEIPSQQPNGASPKTSLWRQSMGRDKSYW